jgi:hypothetical protein
VVLALNYSGDPQRRYVWSAATQSRVAALDQVSEGGEAAGAAPARQTSAQAGQRMLRWPWEHGGLEVHECGGIAVRFAYKQRGCLQLA